MSIDISELKESDKGKWVLYEGLGGEKEKGRIKSWTDNWIFVVYKCDNNWTNWQNYTAAATLPEQLIFLKEN
jgi:hypothetical protein